MVSTIEENRRVKPNTERTYLILSGGQVIYWNHKNNDMRLRPGLTSRQVMDDTSKENPASVLDFTVGNRLTLTAVRADADVPRKYIVSATVNSPYQKGMVHEIPVYDCNHARHAVNRVIKRLREAPFPAYIPTVNEVVYEDTTPKATSTDRQWIDPKGVLTEAQYKQCPTGCGVGRTQCRECQRLIERYNTKHGLSKWKATPAPTFTQADVDAAFAKGKAEGQRGKEMHGNQRYSAGLEYGKSVARSFRSIPSSYSLVMEVSGSSVTMMNDTNLLKLVAAGVDIAMTVKANNPKASLLITDGSTGKPVAEFSSTGGLTLINR